MAIEVERTRRFTADEYERMVELGIFREDERLELIGGEPVHGSASGIAGKNVANPIAQIWTGAMMLEHLGHADAAQAVVGAIEKVVAEARRSRATSAARPAPPRRPTRSPRCYYDELA